MLELRAVAKRLGLLDLREVSLKVDAAEYFVLIGPSGAGKTVLLEIVAGLLGPDRGAVLWNGADLTRALPEDRGFAVVYQDYALFPHMTVEQNIAYGLRARKTRSGLVAERVKALAGLLKIENLLTRVPERLSGGEKQRVALARALAVQPRMLLLDEPLSALDTTIRLRLRRELRRINKELGIPVLHVTHDPEEAMALGDRIGVLLGRGIQQVASPEEMFRRPSNPEVAAFLGMWNVLRVSEVRGEICVAGGLEIQVSPAGGSFSHIWIKPEEIVLSGEPLDFSARNQFRCRVSGWEPRESLLAVRVECGEMELTALVTHFSFEALRIAEGAELHASFHSSAVHCF